MLFIFNLQRREIYLDTSDLQHVQKQQIHGVVKRIVIKKEILKTSSLGWWPFEQGCEPQPVLVPCARPTALHIFLSFSAPCPAPNIPFTHPIHTCEPLTDNDNISMRDSSSIRHKTYYQNFP
jgi:hypothetical protein